MPKSATNGPRRRVAFWGIVDVKYNTQLPHDQRVRVLELGDGSTSGFSLHGRHIRERFYTRYCMDPQPLRCAVVVENKQFTHDRFVSEGFAHLRPAAVSHPREYTPDLASKLLADLNIVDATTLVVLKLCNRSRGAGVVVVSAVELDAVLQKLLMTPSSEELETMLSMSCLDAVRRKFSSALDESCLHWWSNECPFFIAERCCHSMSVKVSSESGGEPQDFDGTMRVSFVLLRSYSGREAASCDESTTGFTAGPMTLEWLGGYWKLPRSPTPRGDHAFVDMNEAGLTDTSLDAVLGARMSRIVSSFNAGDKLTAEVMTEHLNEVFAMLAPVLPKVLRATCWTPDEIRHVYADDQPTFCAYVLARASTAHRASGPAEALEMLDDARRFLPTSRLEATVGLSTRAVISYVERNAAVCGILEKSWDQAHTAAELAVRTFSSNATAYYTLGLLHREMRRTALVCECMLRSVILDPDFKLSYIALGTALLNLGRFEEAAEVSAACLGRYPDSPAAKMNRGQALYQQIWAANDLADEGLFFEAAASLQQAKERVPDQWQATHEGMLQWLVASSEHRCRKRYQRLPVVVWHVEGWRP